MSVVEGAQDVLGAVAGQPDRVGPGGDDQAVVGDLALGGLHDARAQRLGGDARPELHAERVEVGVDEAGVGLALQHGLGQRRAVVGTMPLLPDQGDPAGEAAPAQGLHRTHSGQARSHHHDMVHVDDHNGGRAWTWHRGRRLFG
ncbi:hypothetical protein GCM10020220_044090 [Nonomuraea rubra]